MSKPPNLPPHAQLVAPQEHLAFLDCQSIPLPQQMTALQAWSVAMAHPLPFMSTAIKLRDMISAWFGVKRIGGFSGWPAQAPKVGDTLDFFLI